jgi:hypothetical protein
MIIAFISFLKKPENSIAQNGRQYAGGVPEFIRESGE